MNDNTFEKLQFIEIKNNIKKHCASDLGKALIDQIMPSSDIKTIKYRLAENKEAKEIILHSQHVPLEGLFNAHGLINQVEKGIILSPDELIKMQDFLRGCRKIKSFMEEMVFYGPVLSSYAANIMDSSDIEEEIAWCIRGNRVDSQASTELKKIRRNIEIIEGRVKEKLNKFLTSAANKRHIQEFVISRRDMHYVIPIKAASKNEVEGSIIDSSAKGNTIFVEPASVAKYSQELYQLKAEEVAEEYKVLAQLTELIYADIANVRMNTDVIATYDFVFSKAKYSLQINGISPKVVGTGQVKIVNGRHPLLSGEVVPLNVEIGTKYRGLLITGPNAGGKTVALKTIGSLVLMTQCGFDIPAKEGTIISVFSRIFADIGDNQSMENALSTFSSHIKNISEIVGKSNNQTLAIFDEIGSGTEPNEGVALAISVLEELYQKGCIILASTHYSELKRFGKEHPDFENAGMLFDQDTLQPKYQMTIGSSQNSNALYIAQKMGINEKIIKRATRYMDSKAYNYQKVQQSKITLKEEKIDVAKEDYEKGDKVIVIEDQSYAIVYEGENKYNNVTILYENELKDINVKRIKPYLKASELYPAEYDLNSLFTSFKDRKEQKDIERGSKKALKKIQKQIKNRN